MAVETSVTQNINVINDNLSYNVLPSNKYQLHEYEGYGEQVHVSAFSNKYATEIDLSALNIINDTNMNLENAQILKVPLNVCPPPPHKRFSYNGGIVYKKQDRDRENNKSKKNSRPASPKGYESDESGTSLYSSRASPHDNYDNYKGPKNSTRCLSEQSLVFGKFSNSSPNVYFPSVYRQSNGHSRNTRYYSSGIGSSKHLIHKSKNADNILRRVHGLMERFKSRAYLMRFNVNPEDLLNGGPWDQLNQAIWDVFCCKAQTVHTYIQKLEAWKSIYLSIKKYLSSYSLFIVGSTMSGFGLETSDIDMCLLTKSFITDPRIDALQHLDQVKTLLIRSGVVEDAELIVAKVPILKFREIESGFEIDLNCNNGVGIRNTHLLHCYGRLDWRVRPLVVIVKLWAQANNINDAKNMTISSYSLALMVINYLQCGVAPPVLPCLHGLVPEIFNSSIETGTDVQEDIELIKDFKSDNTNCLGELLIGFLNYYAYFNFAEYAISVRSGSRLPIDECRYTKAPKNDVNQWKFLCIEEPFNYSNTARSVFDIEKFQFIKEVFMQSYRELARNKVLSSILPVRLDVNHYHR